MDNKLSGVSLQEDAQELETPSVENIIEFINRLRVILHGFQQDTYINILALTKDLPFGRLIDRKGARELASLYIKLGKSQHICTLLSEVNERLADADNVDSELIPKIKEIEKLMEELSASVLQEDEKKETGDEVDMECKKVGGYVRKVL